MTPVQKKLTLWIVVFCIAWIVSVIIYGAGVLLGGILIGVLVILWVEYLDAGDVDE